ncbi:DUF1761 domain-containing protein [Patescibacteria group bacterium]|nr:MAG: DUF1761 domain-containing protein [Patescibacteria group bacterium]
METLINYLAVLVGGIAVIAIGALWYSPLLFGKQWVKLSGITEEKIRTAKAKGMAKAYILQFLFALLSVYVLAHLSAVQGVSTVSGIWSLVFWVWLGFQVPIQIGSVLWENKPFQLFVLNAFHGLVALLGAGIALVLIR